MALCPVRCSRLSLILLLALCTAAGLYAQSGPKIEPSAMGSNYNPLAWRGDDAKFALDTLRSSYCVSHISKFVAGKTSNTAVQNLAFTQAYDQEKIYNKLHKMARTFNAPLPHRDDLQDCPETARLRELSGQELDRDYVAFISKNSARDADRFEAESQMPRVPSNWSLWGFVHNTLPVVRQDAASVKELQQQLGAKNK
jgi:hypothetical protein